MYLKGLELYGFKSFPNKIKLEFNKGITVVVGPNGTGKSNILDAIRWVLGEQYVKALRGSKMEDIIFSGTSNRKPLGFAQVSIIIDNKKNLIPIDYEEIVVTRRVYRSGESEFKINNTPCRLKDIINIFMDTGIGKDGYSIISQGEIENIISSKNEDRRFLFEEAVGIVKYKHRRQEALNKLEKEKENISRIKDIILEIESQIIPLKVQSKKANKYLKLKDELKKLQINSFLIKLNIIENKISKINENINNSKYEINTYENNKNTLEKQIEIEKNNILTYEENIIKYNESISELRSLIEQKENDIILKTEQKNNIILLIENLDKQKNEINLNLKNDENNIKTLEKESHILNSTIEKEKNDLKDYELKFKEITNKIDIFEVEIKNYNSKILENLNKNIKLKEEINTLEINFKELLNKKIKLKEELKTFNLNNLTEIKNNNLLKENLSLLENNITEKRKNLDTLLNEKENLEKNFSLLKKELDIVRKTKNENIAKINLLKDLQKDYEGYNKSIKTLLKFKRENNNLKGIIAPVGEIIKVEDKFQIAIECALGHSIENIISLTEYDAKEAIKYLRNNKIGRVTFLPLTSIKEKILYKKDEIVKSKGVIGICKDLIKYENKYENIVSYLLGKVVLVDNIDNSIILNKKYKNTFKIVTLKGEILNIGGSITGGSINKNRNIFTRSKDIENLSLSIENLDSKEKELNINYNKLEENIKKLEENIKKLDKIYNNYKLDKIYVIKNLEESEKNLNNLKNTIHKLNNDNIFIKEEIKNKEEKINNIKIIIEKVDLDSKNLNNTLQEITNFTPKYKNERDNYIKNITDKKVKITILEENYKNIINFIKEKDSKNLIYKENLNNYDIEIKKQLNLKNEKIKEITNIENDIIKNKNIKLEKENKLFEISNIKNKEKDILEKNYVNLKNISENMFLMKNEKTKLDLNLKNLNEEKKDLYNKMWEDYEITLQQALNYEKIELPIKEIYNKEKNIKTKIKELGNININSIEEYKEKKSRYDFLIKQKDDIEESEKRLKNIIIKLNKLMEKKFKSNFNIISKNFKEIFSKMFGGGEAFLKLYDENNILESKIEIIAKPPGKTLQNILLLSGGEKSLTAISLLFAILKMKAPPFCILDEIESALDDANVSRYLNYLKKFSSDIQFILISHRKITMETADILYGVTMEEKGVSKLIGINLQN